MCLSTVVNYVLLVTSIATLVAKKEIGFGQNQLKVQRPDYTFFVEGVGRSYVDHCLLSSQAKPQMLSCEILQDCSVNTSDHLLITVSVEIIPIVHIPGDVFRHNKVN